MLSLVDLKDFAEISRAIEEFTASGTRLDGAIGASCASHNFVSDDLRVAESGTPSHRFQAKASASK